MNPIKYFITATLLFISSQAVAIDVNFRGIYSDIALDNPPVDPSVRVTTNASSGYGFGLGHEWTSLFGNGIGLRTGVEFTSLRGEIKNSQVNDFEFEVRINYLTLPALVRYELQDSGAFLLGGFNFNMKLDDSVSIISGNNGAQTSGFDFNDTFLSLNLGGGWRFQERFYISAEYQYNFDEFIDGYKYSPIFSLRFGYIL